MFTNKYFLTSTTYYIDKENIYCTLAKNLISCSYGKCSPLPLLPPSAKKRKLSSLSYILITVYSVFLLESVQYKQIILVIFKCRFKIPQTVYPIAKVAFYDYLMRRKVTANKICKE